MVGFPAWTFDGAAGKVYETGILVLCLSYGNLVGLILIYAVTCTRSRRMRVVTGFDHRRSALPVRAPSPPTQTLYG